MQISTEFLQGEIRRVEENLDAFCPSRQWQIVAIDLPSSPSTQFDVPHTLVTSDPYRVRFQVLQSAQPTLVYREPSDVWAAGLVVLRASAAGGSVVLLLTVDESSSKVEHIGSGLQVESARLGRVGSFSASEGFFGSGLGLSTSGERYWDIGLNAGGGPSDNSVVFMDRLNGYIPLKVRQQAGDYFIQPGNITNSLKNVYLGNPNEAGTSGWWQRLYVQDIFEAGHAAGLGKWAAYTPAWTQSTTNPTLGDGTLNGRYTRIGDTVFFEIRLTIGSTTTLGTGNFQFTLPTNAQAAFSGTEYPTFVGGAIDASAGSLYAFNGTLISVNQFQPTDVVTRAAVTQAAPFVFVNGDSLQFSGHYEAA